MKAVFAAIVFGFLLNEVVTTAGEPSAREDVLHDAQFRRRAYGTTMPKRLGSFFLASKGNQTPTSSGPLTLIRSMQILTHSTNSNAKSAHNFNKDRKATMISVPGVPAKVFYDISRSALRRLTDAQLSLLLKKHSKSNNSQIFTSRNQMIEKLLAMAATASANILRKAEKHRSHVIPTSSLEPSVLHLQRTTVPASTASPIHFHHKKTVPRVTIRTNEKILTDDEMNLEENANGLSSGNKLSTSKNDKRHKIDEWNVASKRLTGSAKRLKALAITLSQVRATYDKLRKEYLKLYKEFKSTNTTRPPSKLIFGDHSNIDSPLLHINKSRILSNLKALTRLTGMLSRMINVQKKNDSKVVKFQTSKITETPVKNLSQDHKSGVHKNGDMENKATTLISEVKQLMKLKGRHSKPHRNSFKSTRIYPGRMANEDRYHGAIPSDRRKESKTAMTNKKIESHNKNRERTKLGVHNAETSPIKVESATKTAEVPHHTPSSIDESSRKEIPRLISDIEASDNRHNEGGNNEADGSALKPSSTKKDSSSNVNILTKKAQSIKGTGQPADNEDSVEDLVENLKKEYKKVNPPRAMPIPKSYIEDDEKEAMSSVTSMKPITQPPTSTRKVKGKTQHVMKPHVEVGKWNDGTSIRTAEACELVECDFEEGSLCSYESTKDELSPSSRQYLQRTRRFTHKIRRSWHNWRGRYRNRLTGIAHSKIFSGSNKRFAAAYVRPHQWAALSTKLISGEAETIRFSAWEATLGVQLHGCCDTTSNCPFHTELGASRRSRRWMEWTFTCPKRTSKLIFLCENQGINQGACGIDSISLVNDSCKSRLATLRHAENRM